MSSATITKGNYSTKFRNRVFRLDARGTKTTVLLKIGLFGDNPKGVAPLRSNHYKNTLITKRKGNNTVSAQDVVTV